MKKTKSKKKISLKKLTISKLTNQNRIVGGEESQVNCISDPPAACGQSCGETNCLSCNGGTNNPGSGLC